MAFEVNNFNFRSGSTDALFISLQGHCPPNGGIEIALPAPQLESGLHFSFKTIAINELFRVVAGCLGDFAITVTNAVYCNIKSKVRRLFRAASRFAGNCQRRGRRVAPLVPMALRL